MKRLYSIDFVRGFLMLYIIVLHSLIQRVFSSSPGEFETTVTTIPLVFAIGISPLIIISIWGTIFSFMTGMAVAFRMGKAAGTDPSSHSSRARMEKVVTNRTYSGIMIFLVYIITNVLFATQSIEHGFKTHSLLTGFMETLSWNIPDFYSLTATSTLETIALTGIIIAGLLRSGWIKHKLNTFQIVKRLVVMALLVLFISVVLRELIGDPLPVQAQILENENFFWYSIFIRLYSARFAIFPALAFGLMGASMGVILSRADHENISFKEFSKFSYSFGGLFLAIFGLYLLNGFEVIPHFAQEFTPMALQFFNLGAQIIVMTVMVRIFDYAPAKKQVKRVHRVRFFKNFNRASLTIFVLEPLVASSLYILYHYVFGDFSDNIVIILSFILNVVLLWYVI
ncbi:MAG: hypothetical protein ACTSYU_01780, partial [Promethearchaeota archaeon]